MAKVRRVGWWMSMYGAGSPKRQYAWSNGTAITKLDVGWRRMKAKFETARKYVDSKGVLRYHGTKSLRSTENLDLEFLLAQFSFCFPPSIPMWFLFQVVKPA